jgi:periplasmic protein TonB
MQTTTEPVNRVYAMALTIAVHVILFFIFLYMVINTPIPPYPEGGGSGIQVNFGTSENGSGDVQPEDYLPVDLQNNESSNNNADNSNNGETLTQDDIDNPVIEDGNNKKNNTNNTTTQNKKVIKINDPVVNPLALYKKNTKGGSEGETNGSGDQGNPNGTYDSKNHYGNPGDGTGGDGDGDGDGIGDKKGSGISYSLNGRTPKNLNKPVYNSKETGKVVVTIKVDKYGNVIKATAGAKGTTTTAQDLWKLAEDAAMKSKFTPNPKAAEEQVGTITYIFIRQN